MQQQPKDTIQNKLIHKLLLTGQVKSNRNTQARSEEATPQIQSSLREHNRGKENNSNTRNTKTNTREAQQQREPNKATHTRSFTLPPPKESEALCGEAAHETNEHKTNKQQQRGEGGPSTSRDNLYTAFRREDSECKNATLRKHTANQERMRFPSTALLAHETREKTVLILEWRESLELPRQPADDAAVAARLVLAEK